MKAGHSRYCVLVLAAGLLGGCPDRTGRSDCSLGELWIEGACYPADCPDRNCPDASACVQGECVEIACVDVTCSEDQHCQAGLCQPKECEVSITGGQPGSPTRLNAVNPGFEFEAFDAGCSEIARIECDLDGGGYETCTSPVAYDSLAAGQHTFSVRAVDQSENVGPTATFTWTVWWLWIDGGGSNGLNHDPGLNGDESHPTVFDGRLYLTWREYDPAVPQIRVAVYNGNDTQPAWTFVDGDGENGINHDPTQPQSDHPSLVPFDGKLYAIWHEGFGNIRQIRVAVYNGEDADPVWAFVDGDGSSGINHDPDNDAVLPELTPFNGKLYSVWSEKSPTAANVRVKVYNGQDATPAWSAVDGDAGTGLNKDATRAANQARPVVLDSKLYLVWSERNGTCEQIRVAVYNGDDQAPAWTFVDGGGADGINRNPVQPATRPRPVVHAGKLYLAWRESNGLSEQIRVVVYNGNDSEPVWIPVDGGGADGINHDPSQGASLSAHLVVHNERLFASWSETSPQGAGQVRVAEYGGNDAAPAWSFVDGDGVTGLNRDVAMDVPYWVEMAELEGRLYLIWMESNGASWQIRGSFYGL